MKKILLVDDDQDILILFERMLNKLGYEVLTFTNGKEALDIFRHSADHFDVVISDYQMPHVNGAELSRQLLKIRNDIPIIICTGFSSEFNKQQAYQIGVKGYLKKPFLIEDIDGLIRKVISPN